MTEIWARTKKKQTKFYLHLTSSEKHLPETNPGERASRGRCAAASASGPAAITSGATASQAEVRSPGGGCLGTRRRRLPRWGGRAGMAAAAAGAAQEKQFPPALLSFFIYNPRFGPREGEVRGAGLRAGVSRRPRRVRGCGLAGRRAASGRGSRRVRPGGGPGRPGAGAAPVTLRSSSIDPGCSRCAPGPGGPAGARRRRQRLPQVPDPCLRVE